jgi:hypothetical protein
MRNTNQKPQKKGRGEERKGKKKEKDTSRIFSTGSERICFNARWSTWSPVILSLVQQKQKKNKNILIII